MRLRTVANAITCCMVLLWTGCHRGQISLRSAPGVTDRVWREPVQLEVLAAEAAKLRVLIDPPVGYAAARQRPTEEFALDSRLRWNRLVDRLVDYYAGLVELHNSAGTTVQEFNERLGALDAVRTLMKKRLDTLNASLTSFAETRGQLHALRWNTATEDLAARQELLAEEADLRGKVTAMLKEVGALLDDLDEKPDELSITVLNLQ